jgi:hypothetical protein
MSSYCNSTKKKKKKFFYSLLLDEDFFVIMTTILQDFAFLNLLEPIKLVLQVSKMKPLHTQKRNENL